MKYSLATIFTLALAAIASPTPDGGSGILGSYGAPLDVEYRGKGLRMQHVYCADETNVILVGVKVAPVLSTRILEVNRGIDLLSGVGLTLRQEADQFLKVTEKAHGIFGCSQACEGRIVEQYCTRVDSGLY